MVVIKEFIVISRKIRKIIKKYPSPGGEGAEVIYGLRNTDQLANLALNNIGEAGQKKRKVYQRRLPENPNKDYYYIIRETDPMQSLLVEYGFIDNPADQKKLQNNLTDYVEGVVKAIAEYGGFPYTAPGTSGGQTGTYTVQKGDSLYKIAEKYNTTVTELKRLNNLTSDILQIGQVLRLPTANIPDTTYDIYTVQNGDSLWLIAQEYNTTVDELKILNNMTGNTLYVGQQLKVPTSTNSTPPEPSPNPTPTPEEYDIYVITKGDSLWLIAQKYNTTVDELISLNNLSDLAISNLQVGDKLKVPKTESTTKTYIVKSGDSLWSIAKEYNVTVDQLKSANNLTSNLLTIGQVLIIP